jgi:hypothetical protein
VGSRLRPGESGGNLRPGLLLEINEASVHAYNRLIEAGAPAPCWGRPTAGVATLST